MDFAERVFGLYNYWIAILLMMVGFYVVIASRNLIKKIVGLTIFPDVGLSSLHQHRQGARRQRADHRPIDRGLFQPPTPTSSS